jgi:hypothetical protein
MEKSKRIDRVVNSLEESELLRRLPEIEKIDDSDVRDSAIRTFLYGCPEEIRDSVVRTFLDGCPD